MPEMEMRSRIMPQAAIDPSEYPSYNKTLIAVTPLSAPRGTLVGREKLETTTFYYSFQKRSKKI